MSKETRQKAQPLLDAVAEAIGSTLGTLAAKAESVGAAVTRSRRRSPAKASGPRPVASSRKRRSSASKQSKSRSRRSTRRRRS